MPIPTKLLVYFSEINDLLTQGRNIEVQEKLNQLKLVDLEKITTEYERLLWTAGIAFTLKKHSAYNLAIPYFEEACEIALKADPNSEKLIGDFWDLAECYENVGEKLKAHSSYSDALKLSESIAPKFSPELRRRIDRLENELGLLKSTDIKFLDAIIEGNSISYSIIHSGLNAISFFLLNKGTFDIHNINVKVEIPYYSTSTSVNIPRISVDEKIDISSQLKINFLPDSIFRGQRERLRATINLYINNQKKIQHKIWVLPYNECSWETGLEKAIASFSHPMNHAVNQISNEIKQQLIIHPTSNSEISTIDILEKVYDYLKETSYLEYDLEPPSWETQSQKIRFPDEVLIDSRGTCIDLALLFISILENLFYGYLTSQPVLIIKKGVAQHAFIGCWVKEPRSYEPIITSKESLLEWTKNKQLIIMDSTGFTKNNPISKNQLSFIENMERGEEGIRSSKSIIMINLFTLRSSKLMKGNHVTPLVSRIEPSYGAKVIKVFSNARFYWSKYPTKFIQSIHILLGLIKQNDQLTYTIFSELASLTGNQKIHPESFSKMIVRQLVKIEKSIMKTPFESDSFSKVKLGCKQEAINHNSDFVDEIHILYSLLKSGGVSLNKALQQANTSLSECLSFLENFHPAPISKYKSEFPSQITEI